MTTATIAAILDDHYIPYAISAGRICADEMISGSAHMEYTIDVTEWTRSELYSWLGY